MQLSLPWSVEQVCILHINEQLLHKLPKHTDHQTRRGWGGRGWHRRPERTATATVIQDFRK